MYALIAASFAIGLQPAQAAQAPAQIPGPRAAFIAPISPDAAEALSARRVDHHDQNAGLSALPALTGNGAARSAMQSPPSAPIPVSVAELARALKYNPVLIYEFVHNNIEYVPMWGVLKGDTGTLIDDMGSAFDIAQLTADLINADPAHGATATLVRGSITMPDTTAASWIALNGMNICPLAYTFSNVGIPTSYTLNSYPNCASGGKINLAHVWVKVTIGGVTYEIDPSFKAHSAISATVNLATATGYNQSSYLAAACSGCNTNPNIVITLNRAALLNSANSQSLPTFAKNLLSYLKSNNIHDLNQVIGGHTIIQTYLTALPTSLPYTVLSRTSDPFVIDGTWKPSLLVNFNGISQLFSSDAIYGHRLTITFNASNFPQLNLDGTVVQTGTTAVAPGSSGTLQLSACMPFSGVNCSVGSVDGTGRATWCSNPYPVACEPATIASEGTYAVSNSWGPIGHNMVERHRLASIQATNAGVAPTAEANLGEALTTLGFSWVEQTGLYLSLSEDGMRNGGYYYYNIGISGHSGSIGGPYNDMRIATVFPGMGGTYLPDGTYFPAIRTDNFDDYLLFSSVMESTGVNQLFSTPAMSTSKIFDIAISQSSQNNIYDLQTCSDFASYSGQLVGYDPSTLSSIQDYVCNRGYRVVIPQKGNLTDPSITTSPKWTGGGFYALTPSVYAGALIAGGYAGGYSSAPQTPSNSVAAANAFNIPQFIIYARVNLFDWINDGLSWLKHAVFQPVSRIVADPVDSISGSFLASASDISVGEAGSQRLVALDRAYTTADILPASPFGQGWKSNLDISAQTAGDGVRPMSGYDAWDAAEILAEKYVNHDLLSAGTPPVLNVAVSTIGYRWISDRIVRNIATVNTGTSAISFQRLADDTYNPSQHNTARLTGSPSAWTLTGSDGTQIAFGAADANGIAHVSSITRPTGIRTSFAYTSGLLTQVSNNLGRRLNLNWTGAHVTTVTDTPLAGAAVRTVTYTYSGNLLQQVTNVRLGRTLYCYDGSGRMTSYYLPTQGSGTNCAASGPNIVNTYDTLGRVQKQADAGGHVTDLYLAGERAETVTHPGSGVADIRAIRYMDALGNIVRDVSPRTGLATTYLYDALSRLVRTTYPEGDATEISYDIRSNPIQNCSIPKVAAAYPACSTAGTSTHIWASIAYNEGTSVWSCSAINTCNKPQSVTDPLGNATSYGYNADGTVASVTSPLPSGAAGAPKIIYTYSPTASLSGNINLLTKVQVTSTAATTPTITTSYGYDTAANGLTLKTATLDPSGLNYISTFGYDGYGNQTSFDGPRTDVADVTTIAYDKARNPTTITYPDPGTGPPVTQITYDSADRPTSTARKFGSYWMVACTTYTASGQVASGFGPWKTSSATDCSFGGNTAAPLTTYSYDGADRLNGATIAEPTGNRITQTGLYPDNRVQSVTRAAGTSAAATEATTYSNNGLPASISDARGNVTGMIYDGFDRLALLQYPLVPGGGPSTTDVSAFAYDKRGATTKRSIRGTTDVSASCTQCISYSYDQLGRIAQKGVPSIPANTSTIPNVATAPGYNIYYAYDLISRPLSQGYTSASPEVSVTYDNASRLLSSTQYGRTITYSYGSPALGMARTMNWPASAGMMLNCYDAVGRVSRIKEAADCSTTAGQLLSYSYDDLSRRTSISRGNGVSSSYTYLDNGALSTIGHALTGGSAVNYGFGYNRALQITGQSTDNDAYAWLNNYNVSLTYTANGLDQYNAVAANTYTWDSRGNLLSDGSWSYGYDGENRLAAVAESSGTVTFGYDPVRRLRQIGASATTQFLYDGSALIAEYNGSTGALTGRYVPGSGTDETAVAYDTANTKTWYQADARGSVVATSNSSGAASVINQYGPFGEPGLLYQGRNQGRILYTGQIYLPEVMPVSGPSQPLYSFKARVYAPKLGRFLQTDPIGAANDRNLYAYVANDPINYADPSGLIADDVVSGIKSWNEEVGGSEMLQADAQKAAAQVTIHYIHNHPGKAAAIAGGGALAITGIGLIPDLIGGTALTTAGGAALDTTIGGTAAAEGSSETIVIGEGMADRVIPTAEANGASYYNPPEAPPEQWMQNNQDWINQKMDQGCTILDCGAAPGRANYPNPTSPYYQMELDQIIGRGYQNYSKIPAVGG